MGGPKLTRMPWNSVTPSDRTLGERQTVKCRAPMKQGKGFKRLARVGVITLTVTCDEAGKVVKSWAWDNPASSTPAEADSTNCLHALVHQVQEGVTQVLGLDFDFCKSYSAKIRDIIRQSDFTVPDPITPGTYLTSYDCTMYWEAGQTSQPLPFSTDNPLPSTGEPSHRSLEPGAGAYDWIYRLTDEELNFAGMNPNPESSG